MILNFVREDFPEELTSELNYKGWVGDTMCKNEGVPSSLSERAPGTSGNSSGLVGLSLGGIIVE